MFGAGYYGTVKAHSDRWLALVKLSTPNRVLSSMMLGGLIGSFCLITRRMFEVSLSVVSLRLVLRGIVFLVRTGLWLRFAVIST